MEFIEDEAARKQILADLQAEIRGEPRTGAPHVSELIQCLTKSWYGRFKPLPLTEREILLFVVGVGLERVLLRPHKQAFRGIVDGISFEVDFINYNGLVGELKSTRISEKRDPQDLPETWKKQVTSYIHARNVMAQLNHSDAVLAIIHLMGGYNPPFPSLKVWRVEVGEEGIKSHWAWLTGRRDIFNAFVEKGKPPTEFTFNEGYECEGCAYKLICDANLAIRELGL